MKRQDVQGCDSANVVSVKKLKREDKDGDEVAPEKTEMILSSKGGGRHLVSTTSSNMRVVKKYVRTEIDFEPLNRWWEKDVADIDNNINWKYMEHRGVVFTPEYEPHGIGIVYDDQSVVLPPEAEEVANYWARLVDGDKEDKPKFKENVWTALQDKFPKDKGYLIKKFANCDFRPIKAYLEELTERKKVMGRDEKDQLKQQRLDADAPYTYALVDYIREKVGNFRVEPPGLFMGRGEHPKAGQLKGRIFPEEVTLNTSPDAPVPRVPCDGSVDGHGWGDVIFDNTVTWLAWYKDTINSQVKYVFLGAASGWKGMSDLQKYEKARKLKLYIDKIRQDYKRKMQAAEKDTETRQLGTAVYLIDFLALRVGGEKDTEEEADTVGCCSLRREHVTFEDVKCEITLDFLGKDSIRYFNTSRLDAVAYENLKDFCKTKKPEDNIFDSISVSRLNQYLKELMPELSAKVFRTYNASITLQQELAKIGEKEIDVTNAQEILRFYNDCNREVAILCNHQRSVPKQHSATMEKAQLKLDELRDGIKECEEFLNCSRSGKKWKFVKEVVMSKSVLKDSMKIDQVEKKLDAFKARQYTMQSNMRMKDDNKAVALNTSKINYMDPRITVVFSKMYDMPIEKLFNRSLRVKFPWAMYAKSDFVF